MIYKGEQYYLLETSGRLECLRKKARLLKSGYKARVKRETGFSYDFELWCNKNLNNESSSNKS